MLNGYYAWTGAWAVATAKRALQTIERTNRKDDDDEALRVSESTTSRVFRYCVAINSPSLYLIDESDAQCQSVRFRADWFLRTSFEATVQRLPDSSEKVEIEQRRGDFDVSHVAVDRTSLVDSDTSFDVVLPFGVKGHGKQSPNDGLKASLAVDKLATMLSYRVRRSSFGGGSY